MIFVTGGTGFLGAYIIKNLVEKNLRVRALRRSAALPFFIDPVLLQRVEWVEGDVLDVVALNEAMQGVDAVVHSAAVVSFHKKDQEQMYAVNIEGTANVVNAALENGVRRLVHLSSVAALGRTSKTEIITEARKWEEHRNNTHYAISKHHAELQVWRGFAEGLEGVILNPSTVLGYGNWHQSSSTIFKNVYNEFPWYTEGVNGFVGVEDVAEAAVQMLFSVQHAKRFIVSAENVTFRYLFDTIAGAFGKRKPHRHASPFLGSLAWRSEALKAFFTGQKPLLTRETARIAHSQTRFSHTALLQALPGFTYTPLEEVIKKACARYGEALEKGILTL